VNDILAWISGISLALGLLLFFKGGEFDEHSLIHLSHSVCGATFFSAGLISLVIINKKFK